MGLRIDIRVDPQRHPRTFLQPARAGVDYLQLLKGLHIEHQDAGFQGVFNLFDPFSHPGIYDLPGINSRPEGAIEFPAGDDIHPTPFPDEDLEDGDIGIGLGGEAGDMRNGVEGVVKYPEVILQGAVAVNINRCAHHRRDFGDGRFFAPHFPVLVMKIMHWSRRP